MFSPAQSRPTSKRAGPKICVCKRLITWISFSHIEMCSVISFCKHAAKINFWCIFLHEIPLFYLGYSYTSGGQFLTVFEGGPITGEKKGSYIYFFASVCMATRWYVLQSRWRRRKLWLQSVFLALKLLCFFVGSQIALRKPTWNAVPEFSEEAVSALAFAQQIYILTVRIAALRWSRKGLLALREDSLIAQESADLFPRNQASKIKRWRTK